MLSCMVQKKVNIRTANSYCNCNINGSIYVILPSAKTLEFPIIDGKSPSRMLIESDSATLYIEIYELGGVPSDDYGKEV